MTSRKQGREQGRGQEWQPFRRVWAELKQLSNIYALQNLLVIFVVVSVGLWFISWRSGFYDKDWVENVLIEAHGMWFDILILGLLLTLLNLGTEKKALSTWLDLTVSR
ncbi:MAG: hypothetical protein KTR27_05535 [Leptolyngbyaceae cyanobacterium MAG.088]|nr:hypothetical protein [Leptolyngbyaceae cyanobacterium MAG.088]